MAEYDLDEYEDYEDDVGEHEEEGGEYEEEGGEYEYEYEEERMPTQEEREYLELRQKLKESIRKKMNKDPSSDLGNSREKKTKMPYDNFGSFFGPSQPVIAQRVIQESKSLLENPHLAERFSKAKSVPNKTGSSNPVVSKPYPNGQQQPQKVNILAKPKAKIQMLKNTRDYSFLLADDAELPVPQKNPPKSISPPKPEYHTSQRQLTTSGRKVVNGQHEERKPKPLPTSTQTRPKSGQPSQRPTTASKLHSTSLDSRKQVGRNQGSGPGRLLPKPVPSKTPTMVNKSKAIPPPVSRSSIPNGHKHQPSRPPPPPLHKKPVEHRKDERRATNGNILRKPVVSSKPQIKQQSARPPARPPGRPPASSQQRERLQKRPARPLDDDDDDRKAFNMIRNMFGYDPNRYRGVSDDDDSDMEVGFNHIMMEERRSSKIAAMEDEEERKKIEEEERLERMRKAAKKRKLSQ
ncbi:uncharacterized protein LOC143579760 isoform X2 [Bidens hawaiensis]|uniref:uncharacterized protein LOC143579760 isoform X2 n=1 Tax=Bidens hawaiensis TaxID=980011 RepID=UPI0040498AB6